MTDDTNSQNSTPGLSPFSGLPSMHLRPNLETPRHLMHGRPRSGLKLINHIQHYVGTITKENICTVLPSFHSLPVELLKNMCLSGSVLPLDCHSCHSPGLSNPFSSHRMSGLNEMTGPSYGLMQDMASPCYLPRFGDLTAFPLLLLSRLSGAFGLPRTWYRALALICVNLGRL